MFDEPLRLNVSALPLPPRAKFALVERGTLIATVLVIFGIAVLGFGAHTYLNPETVTVTEYTDEQHFKTQVDTHGEVTRDTQLYEEDTTLRNQPVYLTDITPNATITVTTTVPSDTPVHVEQEFSIVYEATRDNNQFWSDTNVLATTNETVENGTLQLTATLNSSTIKQAIHGIENEIQGAGTVRASLHLETAYTSNQYTDQMTKTAPLRISSNWYSVPRSIASEQTHSKPTTRTEVTPPSQWSYVVPGAVGFTATLFGIILAVLSGRIRASHNWKYERVELLDQIHEHRYAEWISEGNVPTTVGEEYVSMSTLEDLVDLGIDMDKRIIYDSKRDVYAVIDGHVVYHYNWWSLTETSTETGREDDQLV